MLNYLNKLPALLLICLFLSSSFSLASETSLAQPEITPDTSDMGELTDGRVKQKPQIEKLGDEKYRIGNIIVDKSKRLINVPGKMLSYEGGKAIEFIATMKNGYKSYESVLMLDVNAFEFNLACILIGLDASKAIPAKYHFDPNPVEGNPVSIRVSWTDDKKTVEYDVVEIIKTGENETPAVVPSVWSYTGSMFVGGDQYLAQMEGVLIGLIHDPSSIIEHRTGLGIGKWGIVSVDADKAPKRGQKITLMIQGLD